MWIVETLMLKNIKWIILIGSLIGVYTYISNNAEIFNTIIKLAIGGGVAYLFYKFVYLGMINKVKKTEVDDEYLGELANILNRKYGLYVKKIDMGVSQIIFVGDNDDDRENQGEFNKKVRDLHRFEDEDIEKHLKKISHKNFYNFKFNHLEENRDEVFITIDFKLKNENEIGVTADEKYMNLAETIGIKGSDGFCPLLVSFDENKETDNLTLKYTYVNGVQNIKKWNSSIEVIRDVLSYEFVIKNNEAKRLIEIIKVPRLKGALEFFKEGFKWEDYLTKGKIFEGMTVEGAYFRSLRGLTHTGVAGQSGSGKSVQLHLTLKSIFYNMEHFEKIYLGDLKGGLELSFLEDLGSDKLAFFGEPHEVLPIILNCELEMDSRMAYMKANRLKNIVGNIIIFIVDEYKQLNDLQMGKSGVSREVGNLIMAKIDRISALGRAMNIKLFLQSQNFTTDSIESSTRNNIQSLVLMKTKNPEIQNACIPYSMREEMPNPANFTTGKKILLDSETGETTLIQALFTEAEEDITIDNSLKAYEMGLENQDEVKKIDDLVKPFKIKVLERHLANESLSDEAREYYQDEYERLTGTTIEADVINADDKVATTVKPNLSKLKVSKEDEEIKSKIEANKEEDDDLMNELDNLLSSIKS
ncbi:MAG: FtsK/SpoIIIE domain-containing protein [Candidatus Gracilibacteria bacterium]